MNTRFVVLGLARPRTPWFGEVGRWATSGSAPLEFIRCVSREEVAANLASGRAYSALLVDGASLELDRDLVDALRSAGSATIVVQDANVTRDWPTLGVHAVLPADFTRADLVVTLDTHAAALESSEATLARALGGGGPETELARALDGAGGRWISVVGNGSGTSVLAMALAQGLGDRQAGADDVVLADLALDADQAMLHAAPDIVPGLSELVDSFRAAQVQPAQVRDLTFAVDGRRYQLLLGLRRHRDWVALRPRATSAALAGLNAAFPLVVADVEADVEGETECGVVEIEERNALSRGALNRSDVVLAVGSADLKGLHGLIRTLGRLRQFGVAPQRLVPVVNRAPRHPRARAEISRAITSLADTGLTNSGPGRAHDGSPRHSKDSLDPGLAPTLFLPEIRRLDTVLRDGARLPAALSVPLANAVAALLAHHGGLGALGRQPVSIRPGDLGIALHQRAAS